MQKSILTMTDLNSQAIFRYNFALGLSFDQCFLEMQSSLGDNCPARETVSSWYANLTSDCANVEDIVVSTDNVIAVKRYIEKYSNATYNEMQTTLKIDKSELNTILRDHLVMRKNSRNMWVAKTSTEGATEELVVKNESVDDYGTDNESSANDNSIFIKEEPIQNNVGSTIEDFSCSNTEKSIIKKEETLDIFDGNMCTESKDSNDFYFKPIDSTDQENEPTTKNILEKNHKEFISRKKIQSEVRCTRILQSEPSSSTKKIKSRVKRHSCKYCSKTYKNKCHVKRHLYQCEMNPHRLAENKSRLICQECGLYFATKFTLQRHSRNACQAFKYCRMKKSEVLEKTFSCDTCHKKYVDKAGLRRHRNYECGKEPCFGCAHCDYRSLQKANLIQHLLRRHGIPEVKTQTICPNCKRAYKNECTLKRHLDFECGKEPSFACDYCTYKTRRKSSLLPHMKNIHFKKRVKRLRRKVKEE